MIVVLLTGLLLQSKLVYYVALIYVSAALGFFLLRTLKLRIEPEVGNKQIKVRLLCYFDAYPIN